MNKEEYYKNRCIQLDKKIERLIDSHTKLEDKINDLQQRIDKAIEILKLCNSKCAKETIAILGGKE